MTTPTDEPEVTAMLTQMSAGAEVLPRLHRLLEAAAQREGLLDIAYRTIDTPVGSLLLAATEQGLVRVAYEREDHDAVLEALATTLSPRILRAPARLDRAAFELDQYFSGARATFDLPLDRSLSHGFRLDVQRFLQTIPYGQTLSYGQVAQRVGHPHAMRAVGTACATNALPIVVPCHRVIRADGGLGGYVGGLAAKTALLHLEAAG